MRSPELVRVAASPEFMLNGVAVSPSGRVFASFPRWTSIDAPSVMEATAEGGFRPYPGGTWNEWRPGAPSHDRIVSSHAVFADRKNHLWIVDDAVPRVAPTVVGAAKLVRIDLATDRVSRVYPLGEELLPRGTMIGHVRVDERFAYVTEAHHGSIVVVDLHSGRARKVLEGAPCTRADPSIVPVIEGREMRRATGEVPQLHVDLLELSGDAKWLYFMPLFGPVLRRIETRHLRDETLPDAELASRVEDVARVPPLAGITVDRRGALYFCSFTENAILRMDKERGIETLIADPRISFPNEPSIGPDGWLYFPASQANRLPAFNAGVSRVVLPFEVFKIELPSY
ncbi:MAG TPA: L-dopachrome tautomerase-related protein [Burkholderiales bacterium]|nr:L-dopachrome tautomerase-related protein [Burkholderiales bacterium]